MTLRTYILREPFEVLAMLGFLVVVFAALVEMGAVR